MFKSKHLSPTERAKIWTMFKDAHMSKSEISKKLNIPRSTIRHTIKKFETGDGTSKAFRDAPRKGRPKKVDKRTGRRIIRTLEQNRRKTARELRDELNLSISVSTIKLFLKNAGFIGRVAVRKPFISEINREKRRKFAETYLCWSDADWAKVLFTDESKFVYCHRKTRVIVRRRPGEKYKLKCMAGTVKHGGGGSILVWGAFGASGVGRLVIIPSMPKFNAEAYISLLNENLLPSLITSLSHPSEDWFLLQDNDPKHKAKSTMDYFVENGVPILDWPPQSPDLNPIENLWRVMKEQLMKENFHAKSRSELIDKVNLIWNQISVECCQNLAFSMRKRLDAVIEEKGGPTRF